MSTASGQAHVNLETQRRGQSGEMKAVRGLSELLKNSVDQEVENEPTQRTGFLLDPSTMVLVGRALETMPDRRVTKVKD
jgi:hypothetical protein